MQPTQGLLNIETINAGLIGNRNDASAPFMCNIEYNAYGELQRRRGTSLFQKIELENDVVFNKILSIGQTDIFLKDSNNIFMRATVIATVYNVELQNGNTENRINISSPNLFSITQNHGKLQGYFDIDKGIQVVSDSTPNKIYIYTNQEKSTTLNKSFVIYEVPFVNVDLYNNSFDVGHTQDAGFVLDANLSGNIATVDRTITIGMNRTFIGEVNNIYFNKTPTSNQIAAKTLDGVYQLRGNEVILKIIEFDNNIFAITTNAIYRGSFASGSLSMSRISNNIFAINNQSIAVVGNFAYVPTIDGEIFRVNLKSIQLEVDTYANKIGSQIAPLIRSSTPINSFYDSYNGTINFLYRSNLGVINEIFNKSSVLSNASRGNINEHHQPREVETILLSKHYNRTTTSGEEKWTASIFNYNLAGMCTVMSQNNPEYYGERLDSLSLTKQESQRFPDLYASKHTIPILADANSNSLYFMSTKFRLDDNIPFNVVLGCPLIGWEQYVIGNKALANSTFKCVISTDFKQDPSIYNVDERDLSIGTAMLLTPAVITNDLSSPVCFMDDICNRTYNFTKSAVSVVNCTLNTTLLNGCAFLSFSSVNFRSFLGYKLSA